MDLGFVLNGIPQKIKGLSQHQDFAGCGTAVPGAPSTAVAALPRAAEGVTSLVLVRRGLAVCRWGVTSLVLVRRGLAVCHPLLGRVDPVNEFRVTELIKMGATGWGHALVHAEDVFVTARTAWFEAAMKASQSNLACNSIGFRA